MVGCRYPKTRSAAEASSPSASAANTTAIWWEGVFSRYKGVWRRARERGTAGLTTKGLDALETAMRAIAHQRMYVCIGDAKVGAISVGTGEALGVYALGSSPPAFHLAPGTRHLQALALHLTKQWWRDDRRGSRLECGA